MESLQPQQELDENQEKYNEKSKTSRKSALDFRKYTKQIWLAGLGAFSRAEEEGNKLFDSLVKVGEELESKAVDVADSAVEKVTEIAKDSVIDTKDKVEKMIDSSVHHSLNRIGLLTPKDIKHVEQLLLQLHEKMDVILERQDQILSKTTKK